MFLLHPLIGPFSPINREIVIKNDVACEIKYDVTADSFSERLKRLSNNGDLVRMARNGFDRFTLDGFQAIADSIKSSLIDV